MANIIAPHQENYSEALSTPATSGSRTSETGGQIFAEIFERPFLGVSRKISTFPKNCHLSPKIYDDLFFSHRPFKWFNVIFFRRGAKSVTVVDKRGAKSLLFDKFTVHSAIITLSAPEGAKLHCQLRWGAMAGFAPPWIRL